MFELGLNPLQVALGGLGFPLSPIAMAVQGLIVELQEERLVYYGGGGRNRPGRPSQTREGHWRGRDESLSIEEVRAQWELLELRLRASPAPALQVQQRPRVALPKPAQAAGIAPAGQLQVAEPALLEGLADDEAELLMLLLADMD